MNAFPRDKSKSNRDLALGGSGSRQRPAPKVLWPALIAINGFGLAVSPASALELGELTVQSALGRPLRASVAYALAPNETIQSHCIFLRPAASAADLPSIRNATANVSNGVIRLAGTVPLREPILNLNLVVDCPGAANLSREYAVFVDPSTFMPEPVAGAAADRTPTTVRSAEPAAAAQRPARPVADNTAPVTASIANGSTYRVRPGDTLSGIAARIADRDIGLWEAVDVIFAANPEAFVDNDRNRLRAGSVLLLPDMGTVSAAVPAPGDDLRAVAPPQDDAPAATAAPARPSATARPDLAVPAREAADAATRSSDTTAPAAGGAETTRPADLPADSPFVSTIAPGDGATSGTFGPAREVLPDTAVDTAAARTAPRVSVSANDGSEGLTSLAWLGGTGIAVILALLLFGRQLKDRFGAPGDLLPAGIRRGRRRSDVVDQPEPATRLADDEPTDTFESPVRVQPVAVDADLGTGSGLDDDSEIDVAQDFGFSTSRDLYEELDMEPAGAARAPGEIIPPGHFVDRRLTDTVIVEKEIPPSDDTGEYELSMIVDATRQPVADVEDTIKDLHAVEVDADDTEVLKDEHFTLSREVDYKILEQDYEEELTATQQLNARLLEEAGFPLRAKASDARTSAEAPTAEYAAIDDDLTMQLPDADLEATAEMPLEQQPVAEEPRSLEDSGCNVEVTTELPAADNDETLDLDIESATIDTKKLRASS